MVNRNLIDTKGSYVKTIPIKDVICDDAISKPSLFWCRQAEQTLMTTATNRTIKTTKTATNKALVEKVTYHCCLEYFNLTNQVGTKSVPPKTLQK